MVHIFLFLGHVENDCHQEHNDDQAVVFHQLLGLQVPRRLQLLSLLKFVFIEVSELISTFLLLIYHRIYKFIHIDRYRRRVDFWLSRVHSWRKHQTDHIGLRQSWVKQVQRGGRGVQNPLCTFIHHLHKLWRIAQILVNVNLLLRNLTSRWVGLEREKLVPVKRVTVQYTG